MVVVVNNWTEVIWNNLLTVFRRTTKYDKLGGLQMIEVCSPQPWKLSSQRPSFLEFQCLVMDRVSHLFTEISQAEGERDFSLDSFFPLWILTLFQVSAPIT